MSEYKEYNNDEPNKSEFDFSKYNRYLTKKEITLVFPLILLLIALSFVAQVYLNIEVDPIGWTALGLI